LDDDIVVNSKEDESDDVYKGNYAKSNKNYFELFLSFS
jgi:hypothetical protein